LVVNHQEQFPVVTISFNLAPGRSIGDAVTAVNRVRDDLELPASVNAHFQGAAQAFEASLGE
jgi:multidrug efflux pump